MKPTDKTHRPIYMTAAMVMTVLLAVTVLLAQDNPEEVSLTEEEFQALLAAGGDTPVGTIFTDEQFQVLKVFLVAEKGNAAAQLNLGDMYANGRGVLKDDAEAARWYRLAAEQGVAAAQFNLGAIYATGEGVLKDSVLAHMWSNIAGANGDARARKVRDILERDMTRAEVGRATELARECMLSLIHI